MNNFYRVYRGKTVYAESENVLEAINLYNELNTDKRRHARFVKVTDGIETEVVKWKGVERLFIARSRTGAGHEFAFEMTYVPKKHWSAYEPTGINFQ